MLLPARRLLVAAATSGLPLTHFVRLLAHHLATASFPGLLKLILAARVAVASSAAIVYTLSFFHSSQSTTAFSRVHNRQQFFSQPQPNQITLSSAVMR